MGTQTMVHTCRQWPSGPQREHAMNILECQVPHWSYTASSLELLDLWFCNLRPWTSVLSAENSPTLLIVSPASNEKLIQNFGLMQPRIEAHSALGCRIERSHCWLLYVDVPDSNPKSKVGDSSDREKTFVLVNFLF